MSDTGWCSDVNLIDHEDIGRIMQPYHQYHFAEREV